MMEDAIHNLQTIGDGEKFTCLAAPDGSITAASPEFQTFFDISLQSSGNPGFLPMIYPESGLEGAGEIETALAGGLPWSGSVRPRRGQSPSIALFCRITPEIGEAGEHHASSIELWRNSSIAEPTQNNLSRVILEELQDEVYVYDVQSLRIAYVNRAARERCDWTAEEALTKRIGDSSENFVESLFRAYVSPLRRGLKDSVTIKLLHEKGPVEIKTTLMQSDGEPPLYVSVLRDVSWRDALEGAKMEFVSQISHELRTPLTSIKGSLKIVQSGVMGKLEAGLESVISIASRNTDRLLNMVNEILDLEKLRSNTFSLEKVEVDLAELIDEAIAINAAFAAQYEVTFRHAHDIKGITVIADPNRLMQVLTNLMSNAVKYSPKGGEVTLSAQIENDRLRVQVSDQGPGIAKEETSKLFKTFSQIKPADGIKRSGSGLGLAIVHTVLKQHGFRPGMTSELGHGSIFYFDIPASGWSKEA